MNRDLSLQQIAEGIPKSVLNASDSDIEGFQQIIDQTLKVREAHKELQSMIDNFSRPAAKSQSSKPNPSIQRSS
ncbi:hypothetical protein [Alteribacillus iranensis]|uniref:Uncharacterized protein n=1 Tax=Alteribacillus iranensis TaxID=930128 RepID=A0A1I2CVB7_9BACI|nr:hypothetical protein [Alteribacillus iranensis]SFE72246.1 hypothetical protein SAMN05192532_103228 [Alteribacillus iranensis]